jgi:hypothetical protein
MINVIFCTFHYLNIRRLMKWEKKKKSKHRAEYSYRYIHMLCIVLYVLHISMRKKENNNNGRSQDVTSCGKRKRNANNIIIDKIIDELIHSIKFEMTFSIKFLIKPLYLFHKEKKQTYSISTIVIFHCCWWWRWIELDNIRLWMLVRCWHIDIQYKLPLL